MEHAVGFLVLLVGTGAERGLMSWWGSEREGVMIERCVGTMYEGS